MRNVNVAKPTSKSTKPNRFILTMRNVNISKLELLIKRAIVLY